MAGATTWNFDFGGDTPESIESGGRLPEGWYRAKLQKADADQKDGSLNLTFVVTAGHYQGQSSNKKLFNPQFSDTPEKARNAAALAKSWAYRLGLVSREDIKSGKNVAIDWTRAFGVERVVQVKKRTYKDKQGNDHEALEIAYLGCFPLDHPDIPADVRTALAIGPARPREASDGPPPAASGTATGAAAGSPGGTLPPMAPPAAGGDIAKALWGG